MERWLCLLLIPFLLGSVQTTTMQTGKVQELYATNVSSNLLDWETDMAIMFYNPGCKYCKQLLPSWQAIATATKANKELIVGKFNCQQPRENNQICSKFGVDRFPSVFFLGYGNYNQAPPNNPFGKSKYPSLVRYTADLYVEAIYDWILMLNGISWLKRRWTDVTSIFTGRSSTRNDRQKWLNMKKQLENLDRKVHLFSKELEKYKALEMFDTLEDYGDPFPLLNALKPDEQNYPLRACIAEMAAEYCKYFETDTFCQLLPACAEEEFESEICRPEKCPFDDKRGCVVTSTCMKPGVIEEYKQAYAPKEPATKQPRTKVTA